MKKELIYIMGTDGSGKTTLARSAQEKLKSQGINVSYLYARYRPFFITPVKLISKLFLYKKNSEFNNYKKYSEIKTNYSTKHKLLAKLYAYICIIDYTILSWPLVMFKYLTSDYIIVDRYIGDLLVILSVASNLSSAQMLKYLKILHHIFPMPTKSFFIDIDEETAFSRKDDIPSIQYLKERKSKYFIYKSIYNFKILDGTKSKKDLVQDFLKHIS